MNFGDLKTLGASYAAFGAYTDIVPSPNWANLINQAWKEFSWLSECLVASETLNTVIGQAQYNLANKYKAVLDVTWNSLPLVRSAEEFERNRDPAWLVSATAAPARWVLAYFSTLILVPRPNAIQSLAVRGVVQGSDMVLDADEPGQVSGSGTAIPVVFHEAVALRAAVIHGQRYAEGDEVTRLGEYMSKYNQYIDDARKSLLLGYERRQAGEQP